MNSEKNNRKCEKDKKRRKLKLEQKRKKRELKQEWRQAVLEHDNHECAICGKSDGLLFTHHIIPKQFEETRYDVLNGITLCFKHHIMQKWSVHQNSLFFSEWLRTHKPDTYEYLMKKLNEMEEKNV